jgi:dolichol-phosphate mannosyltransferase
MEPGSSVNVSYSVIIPAYNEAERIGKVLAELPGESGQFIVVCDGSDATPDLVEEFARNHAQTDLVCLSFNRRLGKGGAVKEGFSRATGPVIGFMDADGSTSLHQMKGLMQALDGYDCVIGSRWLPGSIVPERQGLSRRIESRTFNLLIRLLFGLHFSDTQCGAKVFKKSAVDAVLQEVVSTGFEFDVELLWRLSRKGFSVRECPITWHNQGNSRVKAGDALRMLSGLIAVRLKGDAR